MQSIFREIQETLGIKLNPEEIISLNILKDYLNITYEMNSFKKEDLIIEWKMYKGIYPNWENKNIYTTKYSDWFIERHWKDLGISNICKFQTEMSENFIERFFPKEDLYLLVCYQKERLSEEFLIKHKEEYYFFN